MFLEATYRFIKGYYQIKVEGYFLERFLNLCMNQKIEVWNIHRLNEVQLAACVYSRDFNTIKEIVGIARCQLLQNNLKGVPDISLRYQKRKAFVIVLCLCIAGIYWYSQRIWQIEIVGDFKIPIDELYHELELEDVKVGMKKKDLDFDTVKNHICMRRNDVSWLGFDIIGTKANVEFVERKNIVEDSLKGIPCDIVANKIGVLHKISVKSGTRIANVGDFVESGDLLVSGVVVDSNGNVRKVHSDAEITIKTWYTGRSFVPFEKNLPYQTGQLENNYELQIGKYKINFRNNGTNFEKYDTITEENSLTLFRRYEIPIKVSKIQYHELKIESIQYSREQAAEIAKKEAIENLKTLITVDEKSISPNAIHIQETEEGVSAEVVVDCIESMGIKRIID